MTALKERSDHERRRPMETVESSKNGHPPMMDRLEDDDDDEKAKPTNEYVLNVAFLSFLLFTTFQLFFALLARSQAMMEDCAAMYVDVVTYLFNFLAERFKHRVVVVGTISSRSGDDDDNDDDDESLQRCRRESRRLYRLYLELIPPLISVVTLVAVTVMGLQNAIATIREEEPRPAQQQQQQQPDLNIMLAFSGLNLLLDFFNVSCFATVNQAVIVVGLKTTSSSSRHSRPSVNLHHHHDDDDDDNNKNETTPLVTFNRNKTEISIDDNNDDDDSSSFSSSEDTEAVGGLNLNMCSAWTHICADTLRSIAVLVAAGLAAVFPHALTAADADSWAAIVVSVIILMSLVPLLEGLYWTCCKIMDIWNGKWDERHHHHGEGSLRPSSCCI